MFLIGPMSDLFFELLEFSNPVFVVIAGLTIGLLHAFEPDHLSAVSTQLLQKTNSQNSKKIQIKNITILSSIKGMLWGMGHTSSVVLVGLLIAGFSLTISSEFFVGSELAVGIMLIGLGILTALNKTILKQHTHPHQHENGLTHTHPHSHTGDHTHTHKSYLIGCIHGLAGSGSLVALTASTIHGFDMLISFLILFGVGSVVGMTAASGVMGLSLIAMSKVSHATKYLRLIMSAITLVIGANIVFSILLDGSLLVFH